MLKGWAWTMSTTGAWELCYRALYSTSQLVSTWWEKSIAFRTFNWKGEAISHLIQESSTSNNAPSLLVKANRDEASSSLYLQSDLLSKDPFRGLINSQLRDLKLQNYRNQLLYIKLLPTSKRHNLFTLPILFISCNTPSEEHPFRVLLACALSSFPKPMHCNSS